MSQRSERFFPHWLRVFVRTRETGMGLVAVGIGALSGCLVAAIRDLSQRLHEDLFGLAPQAYLSLAQSIPWWRLVTVLLCGGLFLALFSAVAKQRFQDRLFDAIEANALFGGRLSMSGSLFITAQTLISNAFGASVGLEAAYTQICAACASFFGRGLAARRADMRLLVGCGTAAAIAAAFDAPVAGAFYAFEVVLGTYSVSYLVPVMASAIVASSVADFVSNDNEHVIVDHLQSVSGLQFAHVVAIGVLCAAFSILIMLAVAQAERGLKFSKLPVFLRPLLGGLCVAGLAILSPIALGSGHGALKLTLVTAAPLAILVSALVIKALASAISLGSGFRGGLFFASLLLGSLVGRIYAQGLEALTGVHFDATMAAIAGLAALGTGVIGAPVAMSVLALEVTGDFSMTIAAFVASAISALIVRDLFGYSFATWRFHLRGESLRGPHDVGWVKDMTLARLMSKDIRTALKDTPLANLRKAFPIGSAKLIVIVDESGRYCGGLPVVDLHSIDNETADASLKNILQMQDVCLPANSNVRDALRLFERSEMDTLVVIDSVENRFPIGILTEAHALRRYGEELERLNRDVLKA